jgi:hypothetical protein
MLPKELEAIQGLRDAAARMAAMAEDTRKFLAAVARDSRITRFNWSRVIRHSTATAEETAVDLHREHGFPAGRLVVHSVGGGALEVNVNGSGWVPVSAGMEFPDESIRSFVVRSTTPAAGTAVLRVLAYVGPQ